MDTQISKKIEDLNYQYKHNEDQISNFKKEIQVWNEQMNALQQNIDHKSSLVEELEKNNEIIKQQIDHYYEAVEKELTSQKNQIENQLKRIRSRREKNKYTPYY
ncbi:hypothetical protein C1646_709682 [Rhizophagus diaphanus]|nr:hypothetical protein C1646_709682 [Rhizophagus diaphanus] [Rhizophagus sp. MUCL 43196]